MRSSSKRESLFNGLVLSVMLLSNVPVALRHPALLGEEQFLLLSSQLHEGRRFALEERGGRNMLSVSYSPAGLAAGAGAAASPPPSAGAAAGALQRR